MNKINRRVVNFFTKLLRVLGMHSMKMLIKSTSDIDQIVCSWDDIAAIDEIFPRHQYHFGFYHPIAITVPFWPFHCNGEKKFYNASFLICNSKMLTKYEIEIRVVVKVGSKTIKFWRKNKWHKQLVGISKQSGKMKSKNENLKNID